MLQVPYTSQPAGPADILKNQLTNGLVDAIYPVGGAMISLAGSLAQQVFVDTNSPTMGFYKAKKAIAKSYVAASTQCSIRSAVPAPFNISGNTLKECSMLVLWTTPAALVAASTVFGYGISSSVNAIFELNLASSKLALTVRQTSAAAIQNTAGTATISTSTDYCIVGTRSESNNYHRTYINGVADIDTTCTAIGSVVFDRATVGAFQRNTLTGACGGLISLVLVWNRALTPTEVAALTANPWQVFGQYVRRPLSDVVSGGGGGGGTANVPTLPLLGVVTRLDDRRRARVPRRWYQVESNAKRAG
jgi:hypothetical protein